LKIYKAIENIVSYMQFRSGLLLREGGSLFQYLPAPITYLLLFKLLKKVNLERGEHFMPDFPINV